MFASSWIAGASGWLYDAWTVSEEATATRPISSAFTSTWPLHSAVASTWAFEEAISSCVINLIQFVAYINLIQCQ